MNGEEFQQDFIKHFAASCLGGTGRSPDDRPR